MPTLKKNRAHARTVIMASLPFMVAMSGCTDTIAVINGSGQPIGLILDGQNAGSQLNDQTFTSGVSPINVGDLSTSPQSNEVTGFTNDRPPKF